MISRPTPPPEAGPYSRLVFEDRFASLASIDLEGVGDPSKQWFTDRPFGWGRTAPEALSVRDGVLVIEETTDSPNYSISTASPSGAGRGFQYGYFEARIAFDPADAPSSAGWPSFWGLSRDQIAGAERPRAMEIDFFEAYKKPHQPYQDVFSGTVHEVETGPPESYLSSHGNNTVVLDGVDWTEFHTYGCRWEPGRLTWYFDGRVLLRQEYSVDAAPRPNPNDLPPGSFALLDDDESGQAVILGTGVGFPMQVDWVRVWQ